RRQVKPCERRTYKDNEERHLKQKGSHRNQASQNVVLTQPHTEQATPSQSVLPEVVLQGVTIDPVQTTHGESTNGCVKIDQCKHSLHQEQGPRRVLALPVERSRQILSQVSTTTAP